jgi:hypothetical protein
VAQGHDLGALRVQAGGQDGRLDGLGAAVGEEGLGRPLAREERRQLLGQLDDGDGGEERRHVLQRARLALDGAHHPRVAVAEGDGDDAAEEVEVLLAVGVEEPLALAPHEGQRLLVIGRDAEEELTVLVDDLRAVHGRSLLQGG